MGRPPWLPRCLETAVSCPSADSVSPAPQQATVLRQPLVAPSHAGLPCWPREPPRAPHAASAALSAGSRC